MRTVIRLPALGLLIAAMLGTWWLSSSGAAASVAIRPEIEVSGATVEQLAMARWAVGRFEIAGLEPPDVEIAFHGDRADCGGHLGLAGLGKVDLCDTLVNAMARRALLHEMSHIWLDQFVDVETRARFLDVRELTSWNSSEDPWELRGYEHGAEIMAWALGERILTPSIPNNEPEKVEASFRLLTGAELPQPLPEAIPTAPGSKAVFGHRSLTRIDGPDAAATTVPDRTVATRGGE
jgi:hypothetical protein